MGFSFFCVNSFKDSSFFLGGLGLRFVNSFKDSREMGGKHWKNVVLLGNFFFLCERRTHEQKNSLLLHKYVHIINKEDS